MHFHFSKLYNGKLGCKQAAQADYQGDKRTFSAPGPHTLSPLDADK